VALARALATHPSILLLDEPFASLDIGLRRGLLASLGRLKRSHRVTMVWVSHRFEDVYDLADRVLLLNAGRAAEHGPMRQVLAAPGSKFSAE
jgi:iron(III) transport system ATP-binding protein